MKFLYFPFAILSLVGHVVAWGVQGHEAVGYVAMQFLAPNAAAFVERTVEPKFKQSLGPAAPWADTFRLHNRWSEPFHFLDANDDPKHGSCSVNAIRDCPRKGCILTAIANYTQRVNDPSLDAEQVREALYFIDHFVGDIGQPLHVEALEVGGNHINVTCNGHTTNLHSTWDTKMIVTMLESTFGGSVESWSDALVNDIKSGLYVDDVARWIECSSTKALSPHRFLEDQIVLEADQFQAQILACPLVWAEESNAYDCSNVFNYHEGEDLCHGNYLDNSIKVINEQIAKQGYRLAAWLNVIFDGSPTPP